MRFAYADPPYLGLCAVYAHEHAEGGCWNELTTHARLIRDLGTEFPDGWAYCADRQHGNCAHEGCNCPVPRCVDSRG